jgi:hypothetical protein
MSIAYQKIMLKMKLISQKVILCTLLFIFIMFPFCFAYTTSEITKYLHKKIVITYINDDNHLAIAIGKLLMITKPKNDYTIDDFYAYLIIETKYSFEIVKVKNIDTIRLYTDVIGE